MLELYKPILISTRFLKPLNFNPECRPCSIANYAAAEVILEMKTISLNTYYYYYYY